MLLTDCLCPAMVIAAGDALPCQAVNPPPPPLPPPLNNHLSDAEGGGGGSGGGVKLGLGEEEEKINNSLNRVATEGRFG